MFTVPQGFAFRCRELAFRCRELAFRCRELAFRCRELAFRCRELAFRCRELALRCRGLAFFTLISILSQRKRRHFVSSYRGCDGGRSSGLTVWHHHVAGLRTRSELVHEGVIRGVIYGDIRIHLRCANEVGAANDAALSNIALIATTRRTLSDPT